MAFLVDFVSEFVADVGEFWDDGDEEESVHSAAHYYDHELVSLADRSEDATTLDTPTGYPDRPPAALRTATPRLQTQLAQRGEALGQLDATVARSASHAAEIRAEAQTLRELAAHPPPSRGCLACF